MNNKKKRQTYVSAITNGHKYVGSKNNDYRVNQNSLFGERRYNENPSIAQKVLNGITDKLHLTSPPTFKDGYNRTLNAEVPLSESAQGQELKRMGNTALKGFTIAGAAALPASFYYAPLATTAGIATGTAATEATNLAMNAIERGTGKKFTPGQRTAATFLTSLPAGIKGYKWGWGAEKRAIEAATNISSGAAMPLNNITRGLNATDTSRKGIAKYILTGKGNLTELLDPSIGSAYNGLFGTKRTLQNASLIRSYLYGEPIPYLKEVTGNGKYGIHDNYILKNYPDKYGKIKVYEGPTVGSNKFRGTLRSKINTKSPIDVLETRGTSGMIDFYTENGQLSLDAAGHLEQLGIIKGRPYGKVYSREQDIYKFNPKDYKNRWLTEDSKKYKLLSKTKKNLLNWGLNIVDKHGTPIITRTLWERQQRERSLTYAERLGIPKGMRNSINAQNALDDPMYWGYKQWNQKYDSAISRNDLDELQRLRDLHFKIKTSGNKIVDQNGNPHKVYHGSPEDWYIFDDAKRGPDDVIYFSTDKAYANQYTIPKALLRQGINNPTKNAREFYLYGKDPINVGSDMYHSTVEDALRDNWLKGLNPDSIYGMDSVIDKLKPSNGIEFGVIRNTQMKLADPIVKKGDKIIPIVKRDNFRNPDIRYKHGGLIKPPIHLKRKK